ncbi:uncharacterized protein [Aristolochia californica]|uniref:uncharacterized protein n=1 Tax=Aristolochia californica TaxID=171875 RepID=UPI0035DFE629
MKDVYDRGHREVSFEVGEYVWLRLQPYHQQSLARPPHHKLSPRFFGPFLILRRVGPVAYQLKLPDTARIHDVFHVTLLKPHSGAQPISTPFVPPVDNGEVILNPAVVLCARRTNDHWEILVQWTDTDPDAATWERSPRPVVPRAGETTQPPKTLADATPAELSDPIEPWGIVEKHCGIEGRHVDENKDQAKGKLENPRTRQGEL